jgi:hypothetical protein
MSGSNKIALWLLGIGVFLLLGFMLYETVGEFFRTDEIPAIVKWGLGLVAFGIIISLTSLVFERIKDKKNEDDTFNNR